MIIPEEIGYEIPVNQIRDAIEKCINTNSKYLIIFINYIDCSKMWIGTDNKDSTIEYVIKEFYNYDVHSMYNIFEETWEDVQDYLEVADRLREEFDNR